MKLRNIPLELDIFCEGQEAERILKINCTEPPSEALASDDETSSSPESPDDEFP
jgi:hypothetical protein